MTTTEGYGSDAKREAFEKYLKALRGRVGEAKYKSWFVDLGLAEMSGERVTLSTGSEAKRDMLDHRFLPVLVETWRKEIGPVARLNLTVRKTLAEKAAKVDAQEGRRSQQNQVEAIVAEAKGGGDYENVVAALDARRTFENYAVGDSNRMAYAAARRALQAGGGGELVYIYGESGLGKTHLLHAVCQERMRASGSDKSAYVTYRNLINACVSAALSNDTQKLHARLLDHDLLAFDDIHFLEGKSRTQEELLVMIDSALDSGKQVVIAGDMPPAKLAEAGINKRLSDRLAGGLCAPVQKADESLRLNILQKRLQRSDAKCQMSQEALEFVARSFAQSTRETIGALNQILLMYGGEEITVGLNEAKSILKSHLQDRRKVATLDDAIAAAAEAFGLPLEDMTCRSQPQRIVRARHAYVWCAREVLKESFPRIGKSLKRDHTTVMSSYRRAQALLERDKAFQDGVNRIREALEN